MHLILMIAQVSLGLVMLASGVLKLVPGDTVPKTNLLRLGIPRWLLIPSGVVEVLVALGLVLGLAMPGIAVVAAGIAVILFSGAAYKHISLNTQGLERPMALSLLGISGLVLFGQWLAG
jgi:uncharacterized membrane protein YphA (DoxX/SURF4 family)